MAFVVMLLFNAVGITFRINVDLNLIHLQVERAGLKASLSKLFGNLPELAHSRLKLLQLFFVEFR